MKKCFVSLFLALTTFDMGIKQYIEDTFRKGEERSTAGSKFVVRKVHNKGFCLDTLDSHPGIVKCVSAALCGSIGLNAYQLFQKRRQCMKKLGMTFLVSGAFRNTFDRLVRGYVVDCFGFKCKNSKLSKITANLADIYVVIGSTILAVVESRHKKR